MKKKSDDFLEYDGESRFLTTAWRTLIWAGRYNSSNSELSWIIRIWNVLNRRSALFYNEIPLASTQ